MVAHFTIACSSRTAFGNSSQGDSRLTAGTADEEGKSFEATATVHATDSVGEEAVSEDEENCLICLGSIVDRSVLPKCQHSLFCYDCISKWILIHRRCPLCSARIDDYIIHSIRSDRDYIRHYLPTLTKSAEFQKRGDGNSVEEEEDMSYDPLQLQADLLQREARPLRRQLRDCFTYRQHRPTANTSIDQRTTSASNSTVATIWGGRRVEERQRDAIASWDARLAFRTKIYREERYCLHIGSNSSSRISPPSAPSTIHSSKAMESMLLNFIRRELLAYPLSIDVDFLSRYTINVFKTFEYKTDEAINIIAEFLGSRGAQHFCHEVYSFGRFVGDGGVKTAAGRRMDKVKAFDEWASYERSIARRIRSSERAHLVSQEVSMQANSRDVHVVKDQEQQTLRQQVIAGRQKLLQRLQEEREKMKQTIKEADKEVQRPELMAATIATDSMTREKILKSMLLRKRHEAIFQQEDTLGERMKRPKKEGSIE